MIRRIDIIGLAGFVMVVLATQLLFPNSAERMNWAYWVGGIALWLAGFASVIGWIVLRWSTRKPGETQTSPLPRSKGQTQEGIISRRGSAH